MQGSDRANSQMLAVVSSVMSLAYAAPSFRGSTIWSYAPTESRHWYFVLKHDLGALPKNIHATELDLCTSGFKPFPNLTRHTPASIVWSIIWRLLPGQAPPEVAGVAPPTQLSPRHDHLWSDLAPRFAVMNSKGTFAELSPIYSALPNAGVSLSGLVSR